MYFTAAKHRYEDYVGAYLTTLFRVGFHHTAATRFPKHLILICRDGDCGNMAGYVRLLSSTYINLKRSESSSQEDALIRGGPKFSRVRDQQIGADFCCLLMPSPDSRSRFRPHVRPVLGVL